MGDISDYYQNRMLHKALNPRNPGPPKSEITHNPPYTWWTQANGTRIKVSNMSIRHINNSINKLKRENKNPEWVEVLEKELKSR